MGIDFHAHFLLRQRGKLGARVFVLDVVSGGDKILASGSENFQQSGHVVVFDRQNHGIRGLLRGVKGFLLNWRRSRSCASSAVQRSAAIAKAQHAAVPPNARRIFATRVFIFVEFIFFSFLFIAQSPRASAATRTCCSATRTGSSHAGGTPRTAGLSAGPVRCSSEGARVPRCVGFWNLPVTNIISRAATIRARIAHTRSGIRTRSVCCTRAWVRAASISRQTVPLVGGASLRPIDRSLLLPRIRLPRGHGIPTRCAAILFGHA